MGYYFEGFEVSFIEISPLGDIPIYTSLVNGAGCKIECFLFGTTISVYIISGLAKKYIIVSFKGIVDELNDPHSFKGFTF